VRYAFSFINTSEAGPVVVELPATADAALNGTIIDAWQVPLTDVGIAGEDQGKGGKILATTTRSSRLRAAGLHRRADENF
jgi:hypothetical protein